MKKHYLAAAIALLSMSAHASDWKFAPIAKDPAFKLEPTLALTANRIDPKDGGNATSYGLDFNFNCGLIQDPQNRIRTHINLSHSDKDSVKVNGFELSPRYTVPVGQGLSIGVGPSLAAYQVRAGAGYDETLWGLGVATGINYRAGALFLGADLRYHSTERKQGADLDNWTFGIKAGINF